MTEILIVEDEPLFARAIGGALRTFGYGVQSVETADAAVAHARQQRPDCVLMDVFLSGDRDGIEAGRVLKQQFGVPVVYLTGHVDEVTLRRALETDPAGFLLKPSSTQEIRAAVEVAVREHGLEPTPPFDLESVERQLTIAERRALLGSLTSGMAHEINNPLTYVSANAEYLTRRLEAFERHLVDATAVDELRREWERGREELVSAIQDIKAGGVKVAQIVSDLKAFANPEDVPTTWIDVGAMLERATRLTHHRLQHLARVELDVEPGCSIFANEAALSYVVVCLLVEAGNAIAWGRPEQNEIRLGCRREGTQVLIEVRDTCGLTEEVFDHVTGVQREGVGRRRPRCLCADRVRSLGGLTRIEATTRGCIVTLRFPSESSAPMARRAQILVVDDEEIVGRTLDRTLRDEHDVTVVNDGRSALELMLSGRSFDLVLCDLAMAGMSGQQCYEEARRQRPALAERFVFLTGGANARTQEFLDGVPNARLEKPFDPDVLRAQIRNWVTQLKLND